VFKWWVAIITTWVWAMLSPRRKAFPYHVQKWRDRAAMRPGSVGGEPTDAEKFREDFNTMVELLRKGKIHPTVAQRLPLDDARHAHELLESSASKGKLVLVP
jgi:NADPH:quinone reductase